MKALILVGGQGKRLWPKTKSVAKCMVQICDKPLVFYQIKWLKKYGIDEIIFLTGCNDQSIRRYFGDGSSHGIRIGYSHENIPLGRGGAIKNAINNFSLYKDILVISNGDMLTDAPLDKIIEFHSNSHTLATLMTVPYKSQSGIVKMDNQDRVIDFSEKTQLPFWVNTGIYICSPGFFNYLPDKGDHEIETFPKLANLKKLKAYRSDDNWISVDTMKDLENCEIFIIDNLLNKS